MSTQSTTVRLVTGVEMCRVSVRTPDRRYDVALPVTASIGELLPVVLDEGSTGTENASWVIQRLGGPPLDPGATPEGLGLFDGATLYVNPALAPLPEAEYDDVSVGVAEIVGARSDQWRPEFSRYLLLVSAIVAVGALCVISARGRSDPLELIWCVLAEAGLTVWSVLAQRGSNDRVSVLILGFCGCAVGTVTGLASANAHDGFLTLDHRSVAVAAVCTLGSAGVIAAAGRLPMAVFGTVAAWAAAGILGVGLAVAFDWTATQTASVLAIVVFAFGPRGVRAMLRFAGLRAPLLPSTAAELQEDIEPEPRAVLVQRSARVVVFLDILFLTSGLLCGVACVLLSRESGWISWVLPTVLGVAVLLRSSAATSAWQRAPLAVAGQIGLAAVVVSRSAGIGSSAANLVLLGVLLVAGYLCAAARLIPGRRILPIWGRLADLLETWTAVALAPLLLQLFHVYAHIRSLIH